MVRIVAAITVCLVTGFALGAWLLGRDAADVESASPDIAHLDASMPLEQRLQRLEQIIAEERDARMIVEDQLAALIAEIERIDAAGPRFLAESRAAAEASRKARNDRATSNSRQSYATAMQRFQERRVRMLIDGGFSDDEARQVMRHESEARYLALQQAHDAQRRGETTDALSGAYAMQSVLRDQLGDSGYEKYLVAQGQPTAVQVLQVMENSPGSRAGLQPGDQIVRYNGERVFSGSDLRVLTLQGTVGEDVVIEVERDGMIMQLGVPRGPVGVSSSNAGVRLNWWDGS